MSPEETSLLTSASELFIRNFAYMVPLTIIYGIYLVLTFMALRTTLSHNRTLSNRTILILLIATLIITTIYFCTFVAGAFLLMQTALVKNIELSLAERFSLANESVLQIDICSMWVGGDNGLLYLFSDGIVVWRAWAIWTGSCRILILPMLLLFATFAIFIVSSTLRTIAFVNPSWIAGGLMSNLVVAGFSMSIATNLISTLLIAIKAHQHRKSLQNAGIGSSIAVRILMFLTEAGFVYIVFQIIDVCLAFLDDGSQLNSPFNITTHIWGVIMNLLSATYPPLVILIVHHSHSISQASSGTYLSNSVSGQTHISFARSASPMSSTPMEDQSASQSDRQIMHRNREKEVLNNMRWSQEV
ncbi:hypothetical protein BT96DRAFT_1022044 [Gymnopus androsaceus JB14]|uniref:Uncharacterized protein n=1 Tax=Gymnopus androsaceus JB14 TaxID=1447944 RepID=A0A6A4HAA7_9AGAR|nr:hypothetical protein BT96DRAFT_1022044 [Gymnopus androsaceus JB14]